jgi:hypothetical protein
MTKFHQPYTLEEVKDLAKMVSEDPEYKRKSPTIRIGKIEYNRLVETIFSLHGKKFLTK